MPLDDGDALREAFLREPRRYTSHQVADMAGVPVYRARRLWRALGLPNVADDAVEFTDSDVEALRTMLRMVGSGAYDEEHMLLIARSIGRATTRLAESQAEVGVESLDQAGVPLEERPRAWRRRAELVVPDLARLLVYAWQRQLAAAAGRIAGQDMSAVRLSVGFADLVAFTRLSRQITLSQLASLVDRFEGRSADIVTSSGGRVVKTLGDSVLFVADEAHVAAEIAVRLVETHARGKDMPELRVGLAAGPVMWRMGDVFGTTVNLASRLTALSLPGTILADPQLAEELEDDRAFRLRAVDRLSVRGLGELVPFTVTRAETS
ncbi:adenylate/guanylate cyclase domain-containing protein [Nonomuraea sp. KC401]|uniref:adenylate/guanylate cyclase domain-containing protein n=1 Tax=unclassified Nonomuraea TaxID=2593643 RepID=UPI0010FE2150|nr:adenylate/guanylate cyclase domain-containing protein [Nonomuraea sp. KC401]NBE94784.1 adenylate/guanylate cyclase domain-containing protein [Nonomuraea sp. K271]TLF56215.1 adenylate/guanylate cyclase domain-containing protein [Nonomuraea sp. KC401]